MNRIYIYVKKTGDSPFVCLCIWNMLLLKYLYILTQFHEYNNNTDDIDIFDNYIVKLNQRVKKDQVLSEGFGTSNGSLALGDNILIAFLLIVNSFQFNLSKYLLYIKKSELFSIIS